MNNAWEEARKEWNSQLALWSNAAVDAWLAKMRLVLFDGDRNWVLEVLESGEDTDLLSALLKGLDLIPEELFSPMLRAAVYDPNPSLNCRYINICLKYWGGVRVNEELFRYTTGTDLEKAGVANAFYHSLRGPSSFTGSTEGPTQEQVKRVRNWCLEEFVANDDLQVRRNLIPRLQLSTPEKYPDSLRPLIPQAIAIARNHTDEYIRHRVEIQLGVSGPYMAIPSRSQG